MKKPAAKSNGDIISLSDEDAVKEVLIETVMSLWDTVNNLTRLRPSKRERYRVAIFGSARAKPGTFGYEETKRVASALARLGCDIVTGGGPGLMQAANEGAAQNPESAKSIGIRIELPFEQDVNSFVAQAYGHRTFFTRLHQFVLTSDAYIVAPGGIGTLLEMLMIWQLLQVGHLKDVPLILVGKMWPGVVEWVRTAMLGSDPKLINEEDADIPRCVKDADEAIAIIRAHQKKWKASMKPSRTKK